MPYTRARSRYCTNFTMMSLGGSLRERGFGPRRFELLMVHGLRLVPVDFRITLLHRLRINWSVFSGSPFELCGLSAMPESFRHFFWNTEIDCQFGDAGLLFQLSFCQFPERAPSPERS